MTCATTSGRGGVLVVPTRGSGSRRRARSTANAAPQGTTIVFEHDNPGRLSPGVNDVAA